MVKYKGVFYNAGQKIPVEDAEIESLKQKGWKTCGERPDFVVSEDDEHEEAPRKRGRPARR